jgi:hypothetical protein
MPPPAYQGQTQHHPQWRLQAGPIRGDTRDKWGQDATDQLTGPHAQAENGRCMQRVDTLGRNGRHEEGKDSVESPAEEEDCRQCPHGAVEKHRSEGQYDCDQRHHNHHRAPSDPI